MIRTTPFHERTSALNETGLWSHWSNYLVADRYQLTDKLEYFAVRTAPASSTRRPLYKYRITGRDAEAFLAGVLARDIRACPAGHAQYTCWCDDRGFVVEDGVILQPRRDEYLLTGAEPNFAYFADRIGRRDVAHRGGQRRDRDARRPGPALAGPAREARPAGRSAAVLRRRLGRDRRRRRSR